MALFKSGLKGLCMFTTFLCSSISCDTLEPEDGMRSVRQQHVLENDVSVQDTSRELCNAMLDLDYEDIVVKIATTEDNKTVFVVEGKTAPTIKSVKIVNINADFKNSVEDLMGRCTFRDIHRETLGGMGITPGKKWTKATKKDIIREFYRQAEYGSDLEDINFTVEIEERYSYSGNDKEQLIELVDIIINIKHYEQDAIGLENVYIVNRHTLPSNNPDMVQANATLDPRRHPDNVSDRLHILSNLRYTFSDNFFRGTRNNLSKETLSDAIKENYRKQGYLDFIIQDVHVLKEEGKPALCTVVIDKGQPYTLGDIKIVDMSRTPLSHEDIKVLQKIIDKTEEVYITNDGSTKKHIESLVAKHLSLKCNRCQYNLEIKPYKDEYNKIVHYHVYVQAADADMVIKSIEVNEGYILLKDLCALKNKKGAKLSNVKMFEDKAYIESLSYVKECNIVSFINDDNKIIYKISITNHSPHSVRNVDCIFNMKASNLLNNDGEMSGADIFKIKYKDKDVAHLGVMSVQGEMSVMKINKMVASSGSDCGSFIDLQPKTELYSTIGSNNIHAKYEYDTKDTDSPHRFVLSGERVVYKSVENSRYGVLQVALHDHRSKQKDTIKNFMRAQDYTAEIREHMKSLDHDKIVIVGAKFIDKGDLQPLQDSSTVIGVEKELGLGAAQGFGMYVDGSVKKTFLFSKQICKIECNGSYFITHDKLFDTKLSTAGSYQKFEHHNSATSAFGISNSGKVPQAIWVKNGMLIPYDGLASVTATLNRPLSTYDGSVSTYQEKTDVSIETVLSVVYGWHQNENGGGLLHKKVDGTDIVDNTVTLTCGTCILFYVPLLSKKARMGLVFNSNDGFDCCFFISLT